MATTTTTTTTTIPLLSLFLFSLLFSLLFHADAAQDLATCLTSAGVRNFTLYPSDPSDAATSPYFPLLNASLNNLRFSRSHVPKPRAIVLPTKLSHVPPSVLCLRNSSLRILLRSGGHSYEGLSYTTHETLTLTLTLAGFAILDLMNLNRVEVDVRSATAWVEAGATLGELYVDALLLHPLSSSLLSRPALGPDPFWALRGGGGASFGPVLAWRLRLVPVPPLVSSLSLNLPGSPRFVAGLLHKWQLVAPALPDRVYLSAFVGAGLPGSNRTGLSVTFKCLFLGPSREAARLLNRRFAELGPTGPLWTESSWIESVLFFSGLPEGSTVHDLKDRALRKKTYFKAKSDYVRTPVAYGDLITAVDLLSRQPRAYLILDPYGGAMARIKSDAIAFPHRAGNIYAVQYLIEWTAEDDHRSAEYVAWLQGFYAHMERHVSAGPRAAYVNYVDLDLGQWTAGIGRTNPVEEARAWGERYFLGNYDRLVLAKTAVDPENVFRHAQSIPPLEKSVSFSSSSLNILENISCTEETAKMR
ncbi:reticuline oxidase-like [Ananas comosus]|uniref:Reticuline oxidase-like n=1 Tax=Ananas comosus TaxID=4615 RepID=A0A6P5HMC6_ANACO|nr:reticuline oxidase-like [Ananas comosus]